MVESASIVETLGHERNLGFSAVKTTESRTRATGAASFIQISSEPSARRMLVALSVETFVRRGVFVAMGEDPRSVVRGYLNGFGTSKPFGGAGNASRAA